MTEPKRPLLGPEDRKRLARMAGRAEQNGQSGVNRAYCKGVSDALRWLTGENMTDMLQEVTR